jgi:hypothetical protein
VQFFCNEKFTIQTQSTRNATFRGKPPFPCGLLILTLIGYAIFIIPGLVIHITMLRKLYKFQHLVITVTPISSMTEVSFSYPDWAHHQVTRFIGALPQASSPSSPPPPIST